MEAIILVGGLGTRLQSVIKHVPKPMAPIKDKPFLAYLLHYLSLQGFKSIILATHYLHDVIEDYFGKGYLGMRITYAQEREALGTGGAILNALKFTATPAPVFILNGDTFAKIDYQKMFHQHTFPLTMALCYLARCDRYGTVVVEDQYIKSFQEKQKVTNGLINAGVYLLDQAFLKEKSPSSKFSFETDFLIPYASEFKMQAFIAEDYFIDIGVPEDYERAKQDLPALLN